MEPPPYHTPRPLTDTRLALPPRFGTENPKNPQPQHPFTTPPFVLLAACLLIANRLGCAILNAVANRGLTNHL